MYCTGCGTLLGRARHCLTCGTGSGSTGPTELRSPSSEATSSSPPPTTTVTATPGAAHASGPP